MLMSPSAFMAKVTRLQRRQAQRLGDFLIIVGRELNLVYFPEHPPLN
jgi:hypothetical protein